MILNWREKSLILWEGLYVYWIYDRTSIETYIVIVVSPSIECLSCLWSRSTSNIDHGVAVRVGVAPIALKAIHLLLCLAGLTPSPFFISHINLTPNYIDFFLLLFSSFFLLLVMQYNTIHWHHHYIVSKNKYKSKLLDSEYSGEKIHKITKALTTVWTQWFIVKNLLMMMVCLFF